MAQQKVELRKVRDFSDNLNDTFGFIRQNFKSLVTSFLGIAGIFLLSAAVVNGVYQSQTSGNVFDQIFNGKQTTSEPLGMFNSTYLLVIILAWLNYNAMTVVIIAYMKVFDRNNGATPSLDEVWREFRKYYLKVLFYTIPVVILLLIGLLLCILPGVYLAVVLTPFAPIIMIENETFSGAFNRCFTIIKENFWMSLGIYFVMYLVYSFSSGIVSLIVGILTGVISWFTTKDVSATVGIVTSVFNVFSFVFFIVYYVSVVLHYFNLAERYDGVGILRKLDTIGTNTSTHNDATEEQY